MWLDYLGTLTMNDGMIVGAGGNLGYDVGTDS